MNRYIFHQIFPNEFYTGSGEQVFNVVFENINFNQQDISYFESSLYSDIFDSYELDIQYSGVLNDSTLIFSTWIWNSHVPGYYNGWMINFDDYNSGASFFIDNYVDLNIQDYNYPGITILPQEPQILSISQNEVVQGQNISPYLTTININHINSANDYSYSEIKMTLNDSNLIYNIDCTLEYVVTVTNINTYILILMLPIDAL